jgi:hypothetical protein
VRTRIQVSGEDAADRDDTSDRQRTCGHDPVQHRLTALKRLLARMLAPRIYLLRCRWHLGKPEACG